MNSARMMDIGVVGLGRMGAPIARRLLLADYRVTVWNRTPEHANRLVEAGALLAGSPAEVWDTATVCITMVADYNAIRAVTSGAFGLLTGRRGR